ncbi:MAG: von Willebrand factor type A domain-containing protein [Chloroflexi bacterium]|nr:von Willebrand factor type A domain-containing protein [Chloroflexota bacterium]
MSNDTNTFPIESKLSGFFDKERAETHAPVDLFDRIESNLTEQASNSLWSRVALLAATRRQIVGTGIAAALVVAIGVTAWQIGIVSDNSNSTIYAGEPGEAGAPGALGAPGAPGMPGPSGTRGGADDVTLNPAAAPTAMPAATAAPNFVSADTVVQTVTVERVVPQFLVQTVVVSEQGDSGEVVVTADSVMTLVDAEAIVAALSESGYGISQEQYDELVRQVLAGELLPPPEPPSATFFQNYGVNPFSTTSVDPFSTFAMDVDTASYTLTRGWLNSGRVPPPDAIRVEEFVNYFDQDYPDTTGTFDINVDAAASPFHDDGRILLRIGVNGQDIAVDDRRVATLSFVIDTSGSMGRDNRLGLVQRSIGELVSNLRDGDRIGIVEYGTTARRLLEPTTDKGSVLTVVNSLVARNSTNAEQGLRLGYAMAEENFIPGNINRVILMSDGVANIGQTGSDALLSDIKETAQDGITLSTVGVGLDNFNDVLLEHLADDGDGNYSYIDSLSEATRIFGNGLTGFLEVIATEAKIQVEFNPEAVAMHRLVGYENRSLTTEEFLDDTVDAGEVGAGHTVTAIYELRLVDEPVGKLGDVRVRYADPDTGEIGEVSIAVEGKVTDVAFSDSRTAYQVTATAAMFAEILRESPHAGDVSLAELAEVLRGLSAAGQLSDPRSEELLKLIETAQALGVTGYIPAGE